MRDGAISVYSKLKGNTKVLHVPERPTPVAFVDPSKSLPIYTFEGGYWPCLKYVKMLCLIFSIARKIGNIMKRTHGLLKVFV